MNMTDFWDIASSSLVEVNRRFKVLQGDESHQLSIPEE
jgi:hypothetical protein